MQQSDNDVLPDVSSSSEDNQDEDNVRGESPAPKKRAKMLESSSDEDGDQGFNQQQQEGLFVFKQIFKRWFITNDIL